MLYTVTKHTFLIFKYLPLFVSKSSSFLVVFCRVQWKGHIWDLGFKKFTSDSYPMLCKKINIVFNDFQGLQPLKTLHNLRHHSSRITHSDGKLCFNSTKKPFIFFSDSSMVILSFSFFLLCRKASFAPCRVRPFSLTKWYTSLMLSMSSWVYCLKPVLLFWGLMLSNSDSQKRTSEVATPNIAATSPIA